MAKFSKDDRVRIVTHTDPAYQEQMGTVLSVLTVSQTGQQQPLYQVKMEDPNLPTANFIPEGWLAEGPA